MKRLILIFCLLPFVVFGQTGEVGVGDVVPEFKLAISKTDSASISAYRGKTVVIVFFATWCSYCVKELPHVQDEIWNVYKDNPDFELLVLGREHTWSEVERFAAKNNYSMPFYPDEDRDIFSKFARQSIPRTYLVNKKGLIVSKIIGYNEEIFNGILTDLKRELAGK